MDTPAQPPPSPTGSPILPPAAVPYLVVLTALAFAGSQVFPPGSGLHQACAVILGASALLGLASPGLRR